MVSTVSATPANTTAADATMKQSLGLNKDDFMKLFIAQLQYQDPMKPQDPSAMLDQLSQLTLVEQSYNNNTSLNNLLTAQNNTISLSAVSFIGKNVKANGNSASYDGSTSTAMNFNLPSAAASAQITIKDSAGNTVKTATLGSLNAGDNSFSWDGHDSNGSLRSAGAYTFAISASAANGSTVAATTYTTGKISGVDLSGSTPQLTIGATSVALTDVITVSGV